MDDDCVPEPDCLSLLVNRYRSESHLSIVFPQEIDGRDGSTLNYPAWAAVLIPRSVIETVGLPRAEFFWWMEDTEYLFYRMRRFEVEVVRDEDARVIHLRARRVGPTPTWKLYYETLNSTYMRIHVIKKGYRSWRRRILRRLGYIVLRSPRRFADLSAFLRGLFDGFFKRLGVRYPAPRGVDVDAFAWALTLPIFAATGVGTDASFQSAVVNRSGR